MTTHSTYIWASRTARLWRLLVSMVTQNPNIDVQRLRRPFQMKDTEIFEVKIT